MALRKLKKSEWRTFFDRFSKALVGKRAEIEVASLALGSQVEAKWLPLIGIVHDPKDDIFEVALEDLDHIIHAPRELYIDIGSGGLMSLDVIDGGGIQHIIKLRDPLMLPPPEAPERTAPHGENARR